MRYSCLLLAAVAVTSAGCSAMVAGRGKRLDTLIAREDVRQDFGSPVTSGVVDGQPYDEFRSYRKISEGWKGEYLVIGNVATLGLGEFVWLPRELFVAARGKIVGRTIRVIYGSDGSVARVLLDGDSVIGVGRSPLQPDSLPNAEATPKDQPIAK